MIKAIFFDIDDTLYDSTKLTTIARQGSIKAMINAGLSGKKEEELYELLSSIIKRFGPNYARHYDELLKELGLEWSPKIVAAGVVAYERAKVECLVPFPDVLPTLLQLKERYRLGVVSNGVAIKQWEKLIGLGVQHLFEVVATSEETGHDKPDKEAFLPAIEKLGLTPQECAIVGDRLDTDIAGGNRAGMHTVRLRRGKYGSIRPKTREETPDFEIDYLTEIIKVEDRWK